MSGIILHHYPMSPFAEKVRSILGFKQLDWHSVTIPVIMPKPDLTALTGGYRRTPVLQIGAGVFCDTALIAEVLDQLQPQAALYPPAHEGAARLLAQWADSTLFWTVIPYLFQPVGMAEMFANVPPEFMKAFGADRAAMRGKASGISTDEATGNMPLYLARLENMLANAGDFLFGAAPCIADFSVYHCIWFLQRSPTLAQILQATPHLQAWFGRMQAFGHGNPSKMEASAALEVAHNSSLPALETGQAHALLGQQVIITPNDYALDPVQGELLLVDANRLAIKRQDERAGTVMVNFPRIGYRLQALADVTQLIQ